MSTSPAPDRFHPIALRADIDRVREALAEELQARARSVSRLKAWLREHFEVGEKRDRIRRQLVQQAVCREAGMLYGTWSKGRVNQIMTEVFAPDIRLIRVVGSDYYGNLRLRRGVNL